MRNSRGFTAIDLMIVIAIFAALLAVVVLIVQGHGRLQYISTTATNGETFTSVVSFNANLVRNNTPDDESFCRVRGGSQLTLLQVARNSSGVAGAYFNGGCAHENTIFVPGYFLKYLSAGAPRNPNHDIPPLEQ